MRDKEGFFETVSSYLKKGTMQEIYVSDELAVLRVADTFYIASNYTRGQQGFVAFLVNSKMIRAMMLDNCYLERLMLTSDRQTLSTMMFYLTDKTFQNFRRAGKEGSSNDLQHRFVDPEMEQWIFATYGRPQYRIPAAQKRVFKNIFSKNRDK